MSMLSLQTDQLRELAFKVQQGEVVSAAELSQALHGAAETIEALILKHEAQGIGKSTCTGCKHSGRFEDEFEYGYPCPCIRCKRRTRDRYECDESGQKGASMESENFELVEDLGIIG